MSADFSKVLVKDDRLDVVDNIKYAVIKGGQNVTAAQFPAISASDSQLVFNIQVPSEQTLIDRRVMLSTDLTLEVESAQATIGAGPTIAAWAGTAAGCGYGQTASLAAFPLHQMMTVASATINNNTVSINIRDVLPAIQRLIDERELHSYNGTTPCQADQLYSYTDAAGSLVSSAAGFGTSDDQDFSGRGSVALIGYAVTQTGGAGTTQKEKFTFRIQEPLMLSPFIYSNPKANAQAFYGIQNMNFVLNIGDTSRVFRGLQGINGFAGSDTGLVTPAYSAAAVFPSPALGVLAVDGMVSLPSILSVSKAKRNAGDTSCFSNTQLRFMFLTPHPSDLMPARNIVPFYELPRYITQGLPAVPSLGGYAPAVTANSQSRIIPYDTEGGTLVQTQTLQLNQIPDKLIVMVRKQMGSQTVGDSDAYLPIRHVSINFNNNSGLLASAKCSDLYRMSKDNGSNQNWEQWVGMANSAYGVDAASPVFLGPIAALSNPEVYGFRSVPTVGSCLVLEFGRDIQLVEDFFAPGSLGNFNLQLQLWVENNQVSASVPLEICMITMNSGVFVCERGTSSTYTGILTRADVLEASDQEPYTRADVERMVGGGFLDMIKSGVRKLAPIAKAVAPVVLPHVEKYLKGKLGQGASGGGMSGGLHGRYH